MFDRNGALKTVESYLNNITPIKNVKTFYESFSNDDIDIDVGVPDQPPIDQPEETTVEKMDASHEEVNASYVEIEMEDAKVPPRAQHPFVCPVVGCSNQIKYDRNIQRHIDSKHGVEQEDGTFAIIKYVCQKCNAKNIYFSNFIVHFEKYHPNEFKKYSRCIDSKYTVPQRFWSIDKKIVEKFEYK